jgi:hypothetical protein
MKEPRFEKGQKVYDIESGDSGRVKFIHEENGVWVYTVKLARPHIAILYGIGIEWTRRIEEFHLAGVPTRYD